MALLNNIVPFLLIVRGQQLIASGLAAVINATTPLFSVLLSRLLAPGERIAAEKVAGVLAGIGGVAVLMGPAAFMGETTSLLGMACVLAAAFSYGLSGVWGRRFEKVPPLVTAASQLVCSTIVLLPLARHNDRPWALPPPGARALGALVGLALLSTALAYIVFFRIMAVSGPTNALLVTLLIPPSAILFGSAFLGEVLLPRQLAGALVIGLALVLIDGRAAAFLGRRFASPR
jgi:drug/metabolite transporter (DMT)-like permease